ncbi:tribbles homolog 1-like [Takifugu rubripes]|uniref:Tribbles pseudokinase 1 n=1 Tax=Takifugu rubripes TaxID=31033 RepID=A0A674N9L7_TAKRU|nr:tribbles homolog 1-like [Takifugu rubripes]|eukprot:XP_003977242.1 PREDICTED: tribbles homolog 1-like [Takifugu rubripes]
MNLQWTCPVPCIRTRRVAHKRLDSDDQPPAKCARLSAEAGEAQGLLGSSPGSPVSPVANPLPATHVGPSRIGPFLILPLADRESVHSAMNTDTGEELLCKVFDMGAYQEKIRPYGVLPPHRNVASIRDIILGERKAYVFLDKDFGDMHTYIKSCRRLDEERACGLFLQVARAVAHCHQAGIVLGDLKLRKFVFADERRTHVRLETLEDCRILEDPGNDSMSDTHGCPAYVSPEILSSSAPYSGKMADMWSLGVMLYTMLVGRYPFHDPDPATLFSKIRRGQCCLPEGLSPKAKCLLQSLLRKEPSERLTIAELLAHPWFRQPAPSQEVVLAEQEVSSGEQTVPSFDIEEDDDLFC